MAAHRTRSTNSEDRHTLPNKMQRQTPQAREKYGASIHRSTFEGGSQVGQVEHLRLRIAVGVLRPKPRQRVTMQRNTSPDDVA